MMMIMIREARIFIDGFGKEENLNVLLFIYLLIHLYIYVYICIYIHIYIYIYIAQPSLYRCNLGVFGFI